MEAVDNHTVTSKNAVMHRTLLLNSWGIPHAVLNWEDAVTMMYEETVDVLHSYDETVSSPSTTYQLPAVMQLRNGIRRRKNAIRFSRLNVYTRDRFQCQYCGQRFSPNELNYDHVIPRRLGGKTVWTNIVSSCWPCNGRKGGRTPEQARMKLLRKPEKPKSLPLHTVFIPNSIPDCWVPYISTMKVFQSKHGIYLISDA